MEVGPCCFSECRLVEDVDFFFLGVVFAFALLGVGGCGCGCVELGRVYVFGRGRGRFSVWARNRGDYGGGFGRYWCHGKGS